MEQVIIYSISAGVILFLSFIALTTPRKVNVKANIWLGFFLFSFACAITDRVLSDIHFYDRYPDVRALLEVTRFAMTPALYFSVLYFTMPDRKVKRSDCLHFLPFFLFFLFILTVLLHVNESPAFAWYYNLPAEVRRGVAITVFSSIKIQMMVYWVLSYVQLVRHQRNIRLFASTLEPVALSWLRYFLLGLVIILFISLNEVLVFVPGIIPFTHYGYLFITFYIGYFSVRQQEIYPYQQKDVQELHEIIENERQPIKQERISGNELQSHKQKLLSIMQLSKPYLDPELGLPQLASLMQMSTHDLSYVINEGLHENFFQLINRYRVEEAKILLRSEKHKHLSILGIAFEAGFRSKTTFNTTFKKLTGQSPSQYMTEPKSDLQTDIA